MAVLLLTLRDLVHRRVRFAVVTLLGAIVFALLFVMTGMVEQFRQEPVDTVAAVGADHWVIAEGVPGPFNGVSVLPAGAANPGVAAAGASFSPIVVSRTSLTGATVEPDDLVLIGIDVDGIGHPDVSEGRSVEAENEVVIDDSAGTSIGDAVEIGGRPLTVVGHTAGTTLFAGFPVAFVSLPVAQDLAFSTREVISSIVVEGPLAELPPGSKSLTAAEVIEDTRRPLENAVASVNLVRALLWIMSGIIIGAVVYLSALERQRDFAVLKAVGTSTRALLASLTIQAVLIALAAVAVGAIIQLGVAPAFPLTIRVPAGAFWQVPVIAVVVAVIASALGLRTVASSDPVDAFGGGHG
ncbi:MAG: FtsX-like permease family protein [Actinomycetota bacterium]